MINRSTKLKIESITFQVGYFDIKSIKDNIGIRKQKAMKGTRSRYTGSREYKKVRKNFVKQSEILKKSSISRKKREIHFNCHS